jgi:demethylmenaquinone methyltransferase/2-methoxy-6-polyprenyl-1,4-benzoquinol methylase
MSGLRRINRMALTKEKIVDLYRKRAGNYDLTANLYYLIGLREQAYRKKAVKALSLRSGDTVVEIGCGTGLNFPFLYEAVGPEGKIIGVDLTDAMLDRARQRVNERGWKNVELVRCDAGIYEFPPGIDGVISSFALTLSPDFDKVIKNGCNALKPGKRWVILDFRLPEGKLARRLTPLLLFLTKPFGVSLDLADRHPWESLQQYMEHVSMSEVYLGFVYIARGERGRRAC